VNRLVITADDFGLDPAVNAAVAQAHREGVLSAASLMVAGPAAADAVRCARELPDLSVGLHLTLVDAAPLLPPERIPDLVDGAGRLRRDLSRLGAELALRPALRRQARAEILAQFMAFRQTGLRLDHVNAHRHFHLHPVIAGIVCAVGPQFGMRALRVPREPSATLSAIEPGRTLNALAPMLAWLRARARRAGVMTPDAVFGLTWTGAVTAKRLAPLLQRLPLGLIEIYTHPAVDDAFPGHADGYGYRAERDALIAPETCEALARCGIETGGYLGGPLRRGPARHVARTESGLQAS
jgi:hopanoid biosynthesis associated protein HpnK